MVSQETVEKFTGDRLGMLQRLWVHEVMRVFADRLINDEDRAGFVEAMKEVA